MKLFISWLPVHTIDHQSEELFYKLDKLLKKFYLIEFYELKSQKDLNIWFCFYSLEQWHFLVSNVLPWQLRYLFKRQPGSGFLPVCPGHRFQAESGAPSQRWHPPQSSGPSAAVWGAGDTGLSSKCLRGPFAATRPRIAAVSRTWRRSWRGSWHRYPHTRPGTRPHRPLSPTAWTSCTSTRAWTRRTDRVSSPSCPGTSGWTTGASRSWPPSCRTLSCGTWRPCCRWRTGSGTAWPPGTSSCSIT